MHDSEDFSSLEDALEHLKRIPACASLPIGDEQFADFVRSLDIVTKEQFNPPPPPGGFGLLVKRFRWVIKKDDLNLFDSTIDGLKAATSAGFFVAAGVSAPAQWGAAVGIATAVFKLFRAASTRGKRLPPEMFAILLSLKLEGPATASVLVSRLHLNADVDSEHKVTDILTALTTMPMADGTVRQLTAKDSNGNWLAAGI
jgi:hypothetical protein